MHFRIHGLRDTGTFDTVVLEADSAGAARFNASAAGLAVVDVVAIGRGASRGRDGIANSRDFKLDLFCQELHALLVAGITIGEALETLAEKDAGSAAGGVVASLLASIREGKTLSSAMASHPADFPALLTESMRASERTSDYSPALARFVHYRKLAADLKSKLASASIYPLILLGVSGAVLLFLVGYVVPRFSQVYAEMGDRLPAASRVLLWIGQTIDAQPWVALSLLAAAVAAIGFALRSKSARAAAVRGLRRIPRVRDALTAAEFSRMYRTLALLVHGGIPLATSLRIVRGLVGADFASRVDACHQAISEGRSFSASMKDQGLSTVVADRFFRVGEQTGRLADMVDRAAEFHEQEIARAADWMSRVVGPVLMLIMGCVIGLVVVLMYLPIFQLADAIQ